MRQSLQNATFITNCDSASALSKLNKFSKTETKHNENKLKQKLATALKIWNQFFQKGCFRSIPEKMNNIIEFCIHELIYLPNFTLNR